MGRLNVKAFRLRSAWQQARPSHVHAADRARLAPPCDACRPKSPLTEHAQPKAWPFDTAFPAALPPISTHPGQLLTDMPSAGAQRSKSPLLDNTLFVSTQTQLSAPKPGTADHLGKMIDVLA